MCATCGCMGKKKKDPAVGKTKAERAFGKTPKKLSPKQKKIAGKAGNPNKIDAADLAALRKKKKK